MTNPNEIAKLLDDLRDEIHDALTKLDKALSDVDSTGKVARIYAEKGRNVAMEALSEIRHIRASLTTATNTTPSPETRRATGRSRSRGRRV